MRFDKEYHKYLQGDCPNYNQSLISALEEMEKGGKDMLKYDDDQCVRCGGIRIAGTSLCGNCLTEAFLKGSAREDRLWKQIVELEGKNKKLTALCERLLDHITSDTVHIDNLEEQIYRGYWNAR